MGFDVAGAVASLEGDVHAFAWPAPMDVLLRFAEKLTRAPASVTVADHAPLRTAGLDDRAILDAVEVIAYFNYINRIADGLGVDLEGDMHPDPRHPQHHHGAGDGSGG